MDDDYLWDRKGDPDPDVDSIERALAPLRYREKSFEVKRSPTAEVVPLSSRSPSRGSRVRRAGLLVIAATAIAAGTGVVWRAPSSRVPVVAKMPKMPSIRADLASIAFPVERIGGAPRVGSSAMDETAQLGVGQWLETDADARARISVADIGTVEVAGGSRVRLSATGPKEHRLELDHGSISAKIDAPPRLFVVHTKAATAVDLGCAYTLDVDVSGKGLLHVTSGYVSLEGEGRTSVVEAGGWCETRPGKGPGTPWYYQASAGLRAALSRFDFEDGNAAIDAVFAAVGTNDALTVWHMIPRTEGALRTKVIGKLRTLAPPPIGVNDRDVSALDAGALDLWRREIRRARHEITW